MKKKIIIVFSLVLVIVFGVLLTPAFSSLEKLVNRLDKMLINKESQGLKAILIISKNNENLISKTYGLNHNSLDNLRFDMGSITKLITATAILELVNQEKLYLSNTLDEYFENVPNNKKGITIEQLIMHTSGLVDYVAGDYDLIKKDSFTNLLFSKSLHYHPGTDNSYSNSAYSLLGMIIEKVSGMSYEKFIKKEVLNRASMLSTGYLTPNKEDYNYLNGYFEDGRSWGTSVDKPWLSDGPSWTLRANGGLLTTINDLSNMMKYYNNKNLTNQLMELGYFDKNPLNGNVIMGDAGGNRIFNVDIEWNLSTGSGVIMVTSNERFKAERLLLDESEGERLITKLLYF